MKYTKGKWWACCLKTKPHFVFAGEDKVICSMFCNDKNEPNYEILEGIVTKEECQANAKLIQAAPELLKVCQMVMESDIDGSFVAAGKWYKLMKSTIKKATL